MGDRDPLLNPTREAAAARAKSMTLIYSVMACLAVLIFLQFLLLMVSIEGYLGGDNEILLPAAAGSGLCFTGACLLVRYLAPTRSGEAGA